MKTTHHTNLVTSTKQISAKNDSIQIGYSIQFWPKGKLTFLPSGGFAGEFDSVLLKGNLKEINKSADILTTIQQKKEGLNTEIEGRKSEILDESKTVKQSFPYIKTMIIGLVVLILLLFYWLKS